MNLEVFSFEKACPAKREAAVDLPVSMRGTGVETPKDLSQEKSLAEAQLLHRVARGDQGAFAALYDCYSKTLYSIAIRILSDPSEAEDVLQEVFVVIWEKAQSFDALAGKPFSWAVTITRNKSIDRLRARRRGRLLEKAINGDSVAENAHEIRMNESYRPDNAEQIYKALNELRHDERRPIELAFFSGLTHIEIAVVLEEPLGTIKARIRRGMLRLRDVLESQCNPQIKAIEVPGREG